MVAPDVGPATARGNAPVDMSQVIAAAVGAKIQKFRAATCPVPVTPPARGKRWPAGEQPVCDPA